MGLSTRRRRSQRAAIHLGTTPRRLRRPRVRALSTRRVCPCTPRPGKTRHPGAKDRPVRPPALRRGAETLVLLRAAQAGFFRHAYLLRLRLRPGALLEATGLRGGLDRHAADRLRWLATPAWPPLARSPWCPSCPLSGSGSSPSIRSARRLQHPGRRPVLRRSRLRPRPGLHPVAATTPARRHAHQPACSPRSRAGHGSARSPCTWSPLPPTWPHHVCRSRLGGRPGLGVAGPARACHRAADPPRRPLAARGRACSTVSCCASAGSPPT
jgi:hypothetical protein